MRMTWCFALIAAGCGGDGDDPPAGGDAATTGDAAAGGCDPGAPWATAPAMIGGPTQETAVVALDGKVYVLGGFDASFSVIASVQVFDTASCSWSQGPALPAAMHHANAAVHDGAIYVLGSLRGISFDPSGEVYAWRPGVDAGWSPRAPLPAGTERGAAVAGAIGDAIYVAGGLRGGAVTTVSIYDTAGDAWTTGPALPVARDHACGAVLDGALYVAGGRNADIGSTSPLVYALAPGGAWTERAAMPTARGGTGCGVVDGALIVVGGEGNPAVPTGVFPQVERYAPATNSWTPLANMPSPRHGMGAAGSGGRLYVPGGADRQAFAAVATHEILTP